MRTLWLTRGPKAGTFMTVSAERAGQILAAGMGQDVDGLTDRNLAEAERTDDPYPTRAHTAEPKPAKKPSPRKGTYKRRDLKAEE